MTATVTATPNPAGTPCPDVSIDLAGLSGATINVWRSAAGRRVLVRGFKGRTLVGNVYALTDYEAPFDIPVVYDVECVNASGVLVDTGTSVAVTLDVDTPWIQDALAPSVSCAVVVGGDSLTGANLRRDGGVVAVNGAAEPVGQGGVRRVGAGIPLSFHCSSEAVETQVLTVLRSADPLVVRTPAEYRILPRLAYVTTSEWQIHIPESGGGPDAWSKILGSVDIVAAPAASVVVPVRTYGTVKSTNTTYTAVRATGSYLVILRG